MAHAFSYKHVELAAYDLLARVAECAGDEVRDAVDLSHLELLGLNAVVLAIDPLMPTPAALDLPSSPTEISARTAVYEAGARGDWSRAGAQPGLPPSFATDSMSKLIAERGADAAVPGSTPA